MNLSNFIYGHICICNLYVVCVRSGRCIIVSSWDLKSQSKWQIKAEHIWYISPKTSPKHNWFLANCTTCLDCIQWICEKKEEIILNNQSPHMQALLLIEKETHTGWFHNFIRSSCVCVCTVITPHTKCVVQIWPAVVVCMIFHSFLSTALELCAF